MGHEASLLATRKPVEQQPWPPLVIEAPPVLLLHLRRDQLAVVAKLFQRDKGVGALEHPGEVCLCVPSVGTLVVWVHVWCECLGTRVVWVCVWCTYTCGVCIRVMWVYV